MKKLLYILSAITIFLASCKEKPAEQAGNNTSPSSSSVTTPPGTELWAEQVESRTDMLKPNDWSDADWNATYKNVNNEKIFNTIKDAVIQGRLQAYDYFIDTVKYTPDQVKNQIINWVDTLYDEDPATGKFVAKTVQNGITSKDISAIKVKEKWFFDPKTYTMYKQVTDIAFFVNSYTGDGFIRGIQPLFYVKLGTGGIPADPKP